MENNETHDATTSSTASSPSKQQQQQQQKQKQQVSLSTEDKNDIYLSHRYRLSLPTSPSQSNFRVLALLFFEQHHHEDQDDNEGKSIKMLPPWVPQAVTTTSSSSNDDDDGTSSSTTTYERTFIVGTNDEPGYMGGAICAERAAMVQLRWIQNFTLTKLVIATDSTVPISPGMLCREFLAGHSKSVPWDLPIISTGCICTECGLKNEELFLSPPQTQSQHPPLLCKNGKSDHAIPVLQTTLRELYPYPSPYTRLDSEQSTILGKALCDHQQRLEDTKDIVLSNEQHDSSSPLVIEKETAKRLLELAILEAKSHLIPDIHPIQFGAAALLQDGTILTSHQICGLEYGCTIDAISQLASQLKELNDNNHQQVVLCIVQADQYGIAHGPFAPARSFLSEHGYNDCYIMLHDIMSSSSSKDNNNNNNADGEKDDDVWNFDLWKLRQVQVKELAPTAPDWTTTVEK